MTNKNNFDVVIMSEISRVGRDSNMTANYILELVESNKRVF
jgi:hypothetical protein